MSPSRRFPASLLTLRQGFDGLSPAAQGIALGLLAVVGAFLVFLATPEGLGLSDDSIAYIAGARSLLAGEGYREAWLESNQPVTHFPPAFSGALALTGLAGINPINGARLLNALLFGMNAALLGALGWRMTKSAAAGIVLAALFLVNDSLLRVHAAAMSEPLFLFFSLLAFLGFDFCRFSHPIPSTGRWTRSESCLALTGLLVSFAYLTRYSGLALAATFVLALLFLNDTWKKRAASAAVFLAGFLPPALAWGIRSRLVAGNATNRALVWHPVTAERLEQGLRTFSEFLVPVEEWRRELFKTPEIFIAAVGVILLAVLSWVVVNGLRRFFRPSASLPNVIGFTNGLYIFGYLAAVLFSISFFDASTPLKARILAPLYLPLLLLLVGAGMWIWRRGHIVGRAAVIGLAVFLFGLSIVGQTRAVSELAKGGQGFASFKWYDSPVVAYVRSLPPGLIIYTNEPGAVYLYTGRGCRVLPQRVDPVTGLAWDNFEEGAARLQADVLAGRAALVLFNLGADPDDELLTAGLPLAFKGGGGAVYYAPP